MKKIFSIATVSAVLMLLATGCASKEMGAHIDRTDESTIKTAIYVGNMKTEKAMHAIEEAAKKTGWRVTEFKSNALIVEKAVDGETISRTITVYNEHISGDEKASGNELQDLRHAIVEELQKKEKSSH